MFCNVCGEAYDNLTDSGACVDCHSAVLDPTEILDIAPSAAVGVLERIAEILYFDADDACMDEDKEWDSDILPMIAEQVHPYVIFDGEDE